MRGAPPLSAGLLDGMYGIEEGERGEEEEGVSTYQWGVVLPKWTVSIWKNNNRVCNLVHTYIHTYIRRG
jgi:hypothetical protein